MGVLFAVIALTIIYMIYCNTKIQHIKRLQYKREFSVQGIFENEELVITETIYNNSILPLFFIDVESYVYHIP